MKIALSPWLLPSRPLVCRSFHLVCGTPEKSTHSHIFSAEASAERPLPRLTPMFNPAVLRPMAATSVQNSTELGLGVNVGWHWCRTKLKMFYLVRKFDIAFSFPEWEELPVMNSTLTSTSPASTRHSFSHVPDNSTCIFLYGVLSTETHMFSKSDPWSDKTPDKGWMDFWKSIHERSLLKNCKASKTWIFFPEAASWMRKPRFRCLNLFLWQFQCIPKGSKELFNFNGCRRKTLCQRSWPAWLADTHSLWQDPCRRMWLPASRCQVSLDKSSMLLS